MKVSPLAVADALVLEATRFDDDRGMFMEWFRQDALAREVGHPVDVQQANLSVSRAGVVRGIHFADIPPGQAKYVTCVSGAVFDVVVDIREGSSTFGQWDSVLLDDTGGRAVYVSEGLGHAFMALSDVATVVYLCSATYAPGREHGIHPLDPEIAVEWPTIGVDGRPLTPQLSPKDAASPGLAVAAGMGLLPTIEQARSFYSGLRE